MTIEVPVWMLTALLFIAIGGGLYTLADWYQRAEEETKSYSEFMKSKHRVINPKKKPIWKEDDEDEE